MTKSVCVYVCVCVCVCVEGGGMVGGAFRHPCLDSYSRACKHSGVESVDWVREEWNGVASFLHNHEHDT